MKKILIILLVMEWITNTSVCFATVETGVSAYRPSASPTGEEIVFEADFDGLSKLWVSQFDGSDLRKLTKGSNRDTEAAWSPNGDKIAFTSFDGTVYDIWTINADGSGLTQITSKSLNNSESAWSPDGKKIAFVSDRAGTNDVWMMNSDGSDLHKITTLGGQENHPSFSPDGSEIVFSETIVKSTDSQANLMAIRLDGTGLRSLTTQQTGISDWKPSWGVAGILFSSNKNSSDGHWRIWQVQPDGSGLHQVGDIIALDPTWLPDGRIVFSDEMRPGQFQLSTITVFDPPNGDRKAITDVHGWLIPIDIKPGDPKNTIGLANESLEVAILSKENFNAPDFVTLNTLTFGRTGNEVGSSSCKKEEKDVNKDGLPDVVCSFKINRNTFQSGDQIGILRFQYNDGNSNENVLFEGRDVIRIKNKD